MVKRQQLRHSHSAEVAKLDILIFNYKVYFSYEIKEDQEVIERKRLGNLFLFPLTIH